MNVKFSIVVPYYNREKYLDGCLNSIKNQKYTNFEVICIDDGSTDKSTEIVNKFVKKDSRFKAFSNNGNKGISYSREKGKNLAMGDFLVFIDSDDIVTSDHLMNVYEMIVKHPDIDLIKIPLKKSFEKAYNNFITAFGNDSFTLSELDSNQKLKDSYNHFNIHLLGFTCSFVRRLDLIKNIHYPVDNPLGKNLRFPELVFNLESVCLSKKIGILRKRTYIINVSDNSTVYSDRGIDISLKSFNIHFQNFKKSYESMYMPKFLLKEFYEVLKQFKLPQKDTECLKQLIS